MPLQEHEIPTVVILDDKIDRTVGISTSAVYNNTSSGIVEVFTDVSLYEVDYASLINTTMEIIIYGLSNSYNSTDLELVYKELITLDKNTLVTILIALKNLDLTDLEVELYLNGYLQTALNDTIVSYRINLGKVPTDYDIDVDMYIWGTKFFNTEVDIFSATETNDILDIDVQQDLGRITKIDSDIFAAVLDQAWLDTYICNTTLGIRGIGAELTTQSGRLQDMETDIFSTQLGLEGAFPTDFKTRSLFTSDFFLERDKFTTASAIAWIDIVDFLYPINTDETYLYVDGTLASGVWFTDIADGKRLNYDPMNDFYTDGVLTYSLHAESSVGEVEEKDFYLLYGYNIETNEVVDWGPNSRIVVRVEAQNLVFCPNMEGAVFDFVTADLQSMNLNCTIRPVGYVDLPIIIYPQSTVFYYGKTYTIKVKNVKDFAGNIMPDFEYTFTIEDPLA